ncbi:MAG: hypothetical protein K0S45_2598 [Nitrospira sp.]|nr:hypothetical protein [Nitrospira sp.]
MLEAAACIGLACYSPSEFGLTERSRLQLPELPHALRTGNIMSVLCGIIERFRGYGAFQHGTMGCECPCSQTVRVKLTI